MAIAFHVECKTNQSTNYLIAAMEKEQTATALRLISSGAHVNGKDVSGMTPLMHAALRDQPEIARALLAAGADVNARQGRWYWVFGRNDTALVWCARRGHARVARVLLDAGADPGIRARDGDALEVARRTAELLRRDPAEYAKRMEVVDLLERYPLQKARP